MGEQERIQAAAEVQQGMEARLASIGEWPEEGDGGWSRDEIEEMLGQALAKLNDLALLAVLRIVNALAFPGIVAGPLS